MILLTGSTGFIGRHFPKEAPDLKRVLRCANGGDNNSKFFHIDCLNGKTNWSGAFSNIDVIIHLAALAHSPLHTQSQYDEVNVDGTLHLANEAVKAGVKRFVFVSSIGVNGSETCKAPFNDVSIAAPHNAYSQSKYAAELGLKKIADETGLEVVIIRPTLVYGANAPGNFGALTRLVSWFPALPFGMVNNKQDFIAVQNLVDLLLTCSSHPKASGHTFLASDGVPVSIKIFTNSIANGLGKHLLQLPIPLTLIRLLGKLIGKSLIVNKMVGNLEVDSSKLYEVLNWTPPYTMEQTMSLLSRGNK